MSTPILLIRLGAPSSGEEKFSSLVKQKNTVACPISLASLSSLGNLCYNFNITRPSVSLACNDVYPGPGVRCTLPYNQSGRRSG